jgi:hypothetical protein
MLKFALGVVIGLASIMAFNFPDACFRPSNFLVCERVQAQALIGRYDVDWQLVDGVRHL